MDTMNTKYTSLSAIIVLRRIFLLTLVLCGFYGNRADAQSFWFEGFGLGCSQGQRAINASFPNGIWTITPTGTNDPFANEWYISATEAGLSPGTCRDGCLLHSNLINQTLHIGSVPGAPNAAVLCVPGDCGATYDPGGAVPNQVTTQKRIESPVINCTGKVTITLSFNYIENGDLVSDNATVWYYDGATWTPIADPPKTSTTVCSGQGVWTSYSVPLPVSANNNANVKIGFEWVNNDDAAGTPPSFAVDEITLAAAPVAVTANFSVDTINGGCAGLARHFTDLSTGSPTGWLWSFPGGTPAFSVLQNPVITYALPGVYSVSLASRNASDTDTIIRTNYITIVSCVSPIANFVASDSVICQNHCINFTDLSQNNPTSWQWTFTGATPSSSTAQNPTNICYATPGPYTATLVASNSSGSSTTSRSITVNNCPPPVADFGQSNTTGCDTVCVNFFDLSTNTPTEWHWYFPGATPDSSIVQNPTNICYQSDGLYDVTLIVGNGNGFDTITKYSLINVSSVPTATVNGDTTMAFGDSYQLHAAGGATYAWYVPGVQDTAAWALDSIFIAEPVASPAYTTTYIVVIGDGFGCFTTRQVVVTIERKNRAFIPDAFSPNGDGQNEVFRIRGNNIFSSRIVIYDRWGEKVFETDDKNGYWDGTYNGEKLNSGVFSYAAFIVYNLQEGDTKAEGKSESRTGTIALIR